MERDAEPLRSGEWEALLFNANDQIRHLIVRLAEHAGATDAPFPAECPVCRKRNTAED